MEDASLSDPDPSLQPSRPNDLDSPLLTSNMASPVDENGPASLYWPWNPDISQDLASDPWTPELGRNPASGHDNTLCDPGGSFEEWRHIHQTVSMESHPNGEDTSENFGMHIPLVCSLGNEYGIGLSFDHRGPSPDFGLFGPPYTPTKNRISNNSLNETQRAGYALLAAHSGQPLHNSRLPDGARSYRIQNLDNEPRASDSSASTGEMFFDSNMEKVQPRKLKKKTIEERESYLNVRRRGGACRRHKLTKRAVSTASCGFAKTLRLFQCRCKPESDSSTLPSQTSDGSPREKRRKVDAEVGTPQRQSIASGTPDNSPSLDGSVHDHTQTDHSFPTACKPTGLLASGSVVSPGAFGSRANAKVRIFSRRFLTLVIIHTSADD